MSFTGSPGRPPVVVLRSNDICFLGILRCCRDAGLEPISVVFDWLQSPTWYSAHSKCLGREFEIPNPYTDADSAAARLTNILAGLHRQYGEPLMILPSSDTNLMFILDYFHLFGDYIRIMGGQNFETPRIDVTNKYDCANLLAAKSPDLVPLTLRCREPGDIQNVVGQMAYPVVYKPAVKDYGQEFYRAHQGNKAIECSSPEELHQGLKQEMAAGFDLVVQEKILFDSVHDEIPFYLYAGADGQITMAANGIKEIIEPFPFGTAIALRFAWMPELLDLARTVVAALDYRGILMIEFVRDSRDGNWKVVEVNPRHWLFNGFYQRLGLNYTAHLARDLAGNLQEESVESAGPEILSGEFVHVDLWALANRWHRDKGTLSFDRYLANLQKLGGSLTSVYLDPADMVPGEIRTLAMLDQFQWPRNGLDLIVDLLRA